MFLGKKGQMMLVDLFVLLIGTCLIFAVIMVNNSQLTMKSASLRWQSAKTQSELITMLNFDYDSVLQGNLTVSELISLGYCGYNVRSNLVNAIDEVSSKIISSDERYILVLCPEGNCSDYRADAFCSEEVFNSYGRCCVKLEDINLARAKLQLPDSLGCSKEYVEILYGEWSSSKKVEACQ